MWDPLQSPKLYKQNNVDFSKFVFFTYLYLSGYVWALPQNIRFQSKLVQQHLEGHEQ